MLGRVNRAGGIAAMTSPTVADSKDTLDQVEEDFFLLKHKIRFKAGYASPLKTCSICGCATLRILETRPYADFIARRKKCVSCGHRITTHEILVLGGVEAFNCIPKNTRKTKAPPKERKKPVKSNVPRCVTDGCVHWDKSCTMDFGEDELDGTDCACFVHANPPRHIL